ncbi:MAG: DUF5615 family PIN-like protein [Nitrospirae bacterium]|nr:DUF5615 family PIN-like protein [Fimbriimonadaceae bacterium]
MLLDEDSQAASLVAWLRSEGHDVETVGTMGLGGASDKVVLQAAAEANRVLLTRNCDDFRRIAHKVSHSGILLVYSHVVVAKRLAYADIVAAVKVVETSEVSLSGMMIALNDVRP